MRRRMRGARDNGESAAKGRGCRKEMDMAHG